MTTTLEINAQTNHLLTLRVRSLFNAICAADAFSFSDSPLRQGWLMQVVRVEEISADEPDDVVFTASWESEGEIFEQSITVGNMIEASNLIGKNSFSQLKFHDESGECILSLFKLAPLVLDLE